MEAADRLRPESAFASWWRTVRVAYWLGWQVESNWTDPLLFFIYSIARPLGGALILVFMYFVVSRGGRGDLRSGPTSEREEESRTR